VIRDWFTGGRPVFAFWVAFVANAYDYVTTVIGLELGAQEANALPNYVLTNYGYAGFTVFKILCVVAFTAIGWRSRVYATILATPIMLAAVSNTVIIAELLSV